MQANRNRAKAAMNTTSDGVTMVFDDGVDFKGTPSQAGGRMAAANKKGVPAPK